jgi:hypothetical protein
VAGIGSGNRDRPSIAYPLTIREALSSARDPAETVAPSVTARKHRLPRRISIVPERRFQRGLLARANNSIMRDMTQPIAPIRHGDNATHCADCSKPLGGG